MKVFHYRGTLKNTRQAIWNGALRIGFLGGSITAGPQNWTEPVCNWFCQSYPSARIYVENAAIGSTSSELGVFRAERDILSRGCNLVFVEYAVNDLEMETDRRNNAREGMIRKLLASGKTDVILVYTYCPAMYEDMMAGRVPETISQFEALAVHYHISSVWMGLHAFREQQKGWMAWEEWLPDGIHPSARGSYCYASCVMDLLKRELFTNSESSPILSGSRMPPPIFPKNWQHTTNLNFEQVNLHGPWKILRRGTVFGFDQVLSTASVGAELSFFFEGRGLCLGFDFGKTSSEFVWQIDEGDWQTMQRPRFDWCGDSGWFKSEILAEDLQPGKHRCKIRVIHGNRPDCRGSNFDLALIGVIQ